MIPELRNQENKRKLLVMRQPARVRRRARVQRRVRQSEGRRDKQTNRRTIHERMYQDQRLKWFMTHRRHHWT